MIDDAVIVLNIFDNLYILVLTICIVRDSGEVPTYRQVRHDRYQIVSSCITQTETKIMCVKFK